MKQAFKQIPKPIQPELSEHINSVFIFILLFSLIGLAVSLLILERFSETAGLIGYITFGVGCLSSLAAILCSAVKRIKNKKQRGSQILNTLSRIQKTLLDPRACLITISKLEAYIMIEFCWKFAAIADDPSQLATQTSELQVESRLKAVQEKGGDAHPDDDKLDDSEEEDIPYLPNLDILENDKKKKKLDLQTATLFLKSIAEAAQQTELIRQLVEANMKKIAVVKEHRLNTDNSNKRENISPNEGEEVFESVENPKKQVPQKGLLFTDDTAPKTKKVVQTSPSSDYRKIQLSGNQEEAMHLVSTKTEGIRASELKLQLELHALAIPREDSQPSLQSNGENDPRSHQWYTGKNAVIKKDRYLDRKIFAASKCSKREFSGLQAKTSSQIELQGIKNSSKDSLLFEPAASDNIEGGSQNSLQN